MDRRAFIGTAAATLALPACAARQTRVAASPAPAAFCLPKVNTDPSRLIRAVAGLRPYRAAGFVVREEALGAKRLVHNYGHGGAGITLSWGTSRLAADIGLRGHQGPVAVIGAGIMGLTTARLVQEAGFPVTIYTKALPPDTTSNIAGGQWSPFGHYRDSAVTPEWRVQFAAALAYSWRRFQIMVGEDYGVRWLPTYTDAGDENAAPSPLDAYHPGHRILGPAEHPFPQERVARFETMYVETGRFLRQLTRDVEGSGGAIRIRDFATPADIAPLPETLVFNCTGLGSRNLFGDTAMEPRRGQLAIMLPQPEIGYAYTGNAGYMFPRADGIILGGTFERGEWSIEPEPVAIQRIIVDHQRIMAGWRCA